VTTPIGSSTSVSPAPSLGAVDDGVSLIYASISNLRQMDVSSGEKTVEEDQGVSQQERAQQEAAIKKEQANQANSGRGFFSSIGHLISDVTGDLVHGHIGDAIHDAGHDLSEAWNSPKFWHDFEVGLEGTAIVAAAVVTAGVGGAAVGAVAVGVGAAAGAGAGLAEARSEHFAAAAEDASADATGAQDRIDDLQQLTTDVLSNVEQDNDAHQRALQSLAHTIEANDQTLVAAASTTVRG
jgi:hypothetical protein